MATAPFFEDDVDLDITDHLEAQAVADGIAAVLEDLGHDGFETRLAADYASVTVDFASLQDPTIVAAIIRLFEGPRLACIGQRHSADGSSFDFAAATDDALPSRTETEAQRVRDSGRVLVLSMRPSAESRGCACSGDMEDRPTEQPIGMAVFVHDEDGDPILSCVFMDRGTALKGIETQMRAEGVRDWAVRDEEGVLELFGDAADALAGEATDDPEPSTEDAGRFDRLSDQHHWENEQETLDPETVETIRENGEIEQDAFMRTLRKAA